MKSIYITGYMGAGKTTIGKVLSKELHMDSCRYRPKN